MTKTCASAGTVDGTAIVVDIATVVGAETVVVTDDRTVVGTETVVETGTIPGTEAIAVAKTRAGTRAGTGTLGVVASVFVLLSSTFPSFFVFF